VTTTPAATQTLTAELWSSSDDVFAAIMAHPFIDELAAGTLPRDRFAHYIVQDTHYLRGYANALSILAGRAPDPAATGLFASHASGAVAVEQEFHAGFLTELSLAGDRLPEPAPITVAYTSYLLAATHGGSFAEGVAAVLPCYWIYWEVGKALLQRSSPDPLYARWIETYGGEGFAAVVRPVLELADRVGDEVAPTERARMAEHYAMASRYEWMFWDAAYRMEGWPL
jgi:thiaminase/transcriptional activator TenA